MAQSSLLISGMKPSISSSLDLQGIFLQMTLWLTTDMEPFDSELLARVQALYREIEERTLEITSLRRSTPVEAASIFQQSCTFTGQVSNTESTTAPLQVESSINISREDEVNETFAQGMKILKDLKRGVPATAAKLERAKEVVKHVSMY